MNKPLQSHRNIISPFPTIFTEKNLHWLLLPEPTKATTSEVQWGGHLSRIPLFRDAAVSLHMLRVPLKCSGWHHGLFPITAETTATSLLRPSLWCQYFPASEEKLWFSSGLFTENYPHPIRLQDRQGYILFWIIALSLMAITLEPNLGLSAFLLLKPFPRALDGHTYKKKITGRYALTSPQDSLRQTQLIFTLTLQLHGHVLFTSHNHQIVEARW